MFEKEVNFFAIGGLTHARMAQTATDVAGRDTEVHALEAEITELRNTVQQLRQAGKDALARHVPQVGILKKKKKGVLVPSLLICMRRGRS
jgi:outer membrane murein-binding lipoprotein Lpp